MPRGGSVPVNKGRRLCVRRHDHDEVERVWTQRRHARFGLSVTMPVLSWTFSDAPPGARCASRYHL